METAGYGMRADGGAPSASRRTFLKGSGLALAGTAALVGGSAACAGASEAAADGAEQQDAVQPAMDVEVFEADVLIIGAGNAASAAAWSVAREGKSMLIVNKGPVAQGGSTGTSWAGFTTITDLAPETPLSEYMQAWINKPIGAYLVNHQLYRNALDLYREGGRDYNSRVRAVDAINNGLYMVSRDEDGQIIPFGGSMAQHRPWGRAHQRCFLGRPPFPLRDGPSAAYAPAMLYNRVATTGRDTRFLRWGRVADASRRLGHIAVGPSRPAPSSRSDACASVWPPFLSASAP